MNRFFTVLLNGWSMDSKSVSAEDNAELLVIFFAGVLVIILVAEPVFFTDQIEPFFRFVGLHDGWIVASGFLQEFFREFGLLVIGLVVLYLGLVVFGRKQVSKK